MRHLLKINNKSIFEHIDWRRKPIFILLLTIAVSCIHKSDDKAATMAASISDWPLTIQDHKVGLVSTGIKINEAIKIISKYFTVEPDSIISSDNETYSFFYNVKNQDGKTIFNIHPSTDKGNGREYVYSYEVLGSEYIINNTNICVGMKVSDLKEAFTLSETYFDYENGLYLFASDFQGSFSIELDSEHTNSLGDFNYYTPEDIPENFQIKAIIVY